MTTVYTLPSCVQCDMTKRLLDKNSIPYRVEDLSSPENAAKLASFKEQGLSAAPIVETVDNVWSGFRPDLIGALA